jgi:uncharacterized protein YfiM (DUF2279 family)
MVKFIFVTFLISFCLSAQAIDSLNIKRKNTVMISQGILTSGALVGLHELWYKDFEKSSFHFKDDAKHWLQMDKAGHFHSAYHLNRLSADLMAWSGETKKNQYLYGFIYTQAFLTTVEIFDGFSKAWGFSWSDLSANLIGSGLFVGQDILWQEQRIIPKFSFQTTTFAQQRPEALGKSFSEQLLKDYNGQTYWLSFNIHAFTKNKDIPKFLNIALGYGAEGMLTATPTNQTEDKRYRQFYLSLDIDLQRIETKKRWLKSLFSILNVLKVPFPALEFSTKNVVKGHLFHY